MEDPDRRLERMGFALDRRCPEGKFVDAISIADQLVYVSGHIPMDGDELRSAGKVPSQVTVDAATTAAALCAANCLRSFIHQLGSLRRIEKVVRVTGYVNADPQFTDEHLVINGASRLLLEVLGDRGRHARTALGVEQLPLGASVEIEMIILLKPGTVE